MHITTTARLVKVLKFSAKAARAFCSLGVLLPHIATFFGHQMLSLRCVMMSALRRVVLHLRGEYAIIRKPANCLVWHPPAVLIDLRVAALGHVHRGRAWSPHANRLSRIPVVWSCLRGPPGRHGCRAGANCTALREPPVQGGGFSGQVSTLRRVPVVWSRLGAPRGRHGHGAGANCTALREPPVQGWGFSGQVSTLRRVPVVGRCLTISLLQRPDGYLSPIRRCCWRRELNPAQEPDAADIYLGVP